MSLPTLKSYLENYLRAKAIDTVFQGENEPYSGASQLVLRTLKENFEFTGLKTVPIYNIDKEIKYFYQKQNYEYQGETPENRYRSHLENRMAKKFGERTYMFREKKYGDLIIIHLMPFSNGFFCSTYSNREKME